MQSVSSAFAWFQYRFMFSLVMGMRRWGKGLVSFVDDTELVVGF